MPDTNYIGSTLVIALGALEIAPAGLRYVLKDSFEDAISVYTPWVEGKSPLSPMIGFQASAFFTVFVFGFIGFHTFNIKHEPSRAALTSSAFARIVIAAAIFGIVQLKNAHPALLGFTIVEGLGGMGTLFSDWRIFSLIPLLFYASLGGAAFHILMVYKMYDPLLVQLGIDELPDPDSEAGNLIFQTLVLVLGFGSGLLKILIGFSAEAKGIRTIGKVCMVKSILFMYWHAHRRFDEDATKIIAIVLGVIGVLILFFVHEPKVRKVLRRKVPAVKKDQ